MGFIAEFNDDADQTQPDHKTIFGNLNSGAKQLRNLHLQDPEPPAREEKLSSAVNTFLAHLEEAVEAGPVALAHHMNLNAKEAFAKFSQQYLLDTAFKIWEDPRRTNDTDPPPQSTTSYLGSQLGLGTQLRLMLVGFVKSSKPLPIGLGPLNQEGRAANARLGLISSRSQATKTGSRISCHARTMVFG